MEELGLGPNGGLMYCMEYPFHIFFLCLFYDLLLIAIYLLRTWKKQLNQLPYSLGARFLLYKTFNF